MHVVRRREQTSCSVHSLARLGSCRYECKEPEPAKFTLAFSSFENAVPAPYLHLHCWQLSRPASSSLSRLSTRPCHAKT